MDIFDKIDEANRISKTLMRLISEIGQDLGGNRIESIMFGEGMTVGVAYYLDSLPKRGKRKRR